VEEVTAFCAAVGANLIWIVFGDGPQGPATKQATRYFRLLAAIEQVEHDGRLAEYQEATGLTAERIARLRSKPGVAISDRVARRAEQFCEEKAGAFGRCPRDRRVQALLTVYFTLPPERRDVLSNTAQALLDQSAT
jgi:hypothetical protein